MTTRSARFRRIVVGFDSAGEPHLLVETATSIARATRSAVHGVFVEDATLTTLADLPFVRLVQAPGAGPGQVTRERMQAAIQREATACERALSQSARRARLHWSFDRAHGLLRDEIETSAEAEDLVLVRADPHTGTTVLQALAAARSPRFKGAGLVVVPRLARPVRGPLALLSAADRFSPNVVQFAASLADARRENLGVLLVAPDEAAMTRLGSELHEAALHRPITIYRLIGGQLSHLAGLLREIGASLVTADLSGSPFRDDPTALALLSAAAAPVILLRRPDKREGMGDPA
ncbi:hypothetical protein [Rhodoligotrophos ferricapiens]|uniref:hypothetical protein n=1 Tax=Rhodoligotrophos ferricapiens TaxID=3069264 RepID=UPI00315D0AE3